MINSGCITKGRSSNLTFWTFWLKVKMCSVVGCNEELKRNSRNDKTHPLCEKHKRVAVARCADGKEVCFCFYCLKTHDVNYFTHSTNICDKTYIRRKEKEKQKRETRKKKITDDEEKYTLWSVAKVLSLRDAAETLEKSETQLKILCRACGIKKWPYRQFRTLFSLLNCSALSAAERDFASNILQTSIQHQFTFSQNDRRRYDALVQKVVYKVNFERGLCPLKSLV